MNHLCPNPTCAYPTNVIRDGHFRRREDARTIQRFRCKSCLQRFSSATFSDAYRQKKRRLHPVLIRLLSSGVSLRRCALLLSVHRTTVERKLPLLAHHCRRLNQRHMRQFVGRIQRLQIDDLITKENSKLKPLSVSVAVDQDRRTIVAVEVSQIPAFGHLAKFARKKYGHRRDEHEKGLGRMMEQVALFATSGCTIRSDEHQRYPRLIRRHLPQARHEHFVSERSCVAGQGELKKTRFDPLFVINHTCAMLRANVNRLIRKTWCTTKRPDRLKEHLDIFIYFHNVFLLKQHQHQSTRAVHK